MDAERFVVISPVRNEADHFADVCRSLESQTVQPLRWVIVDDGSSDATGRLADEAAVRHDWIRVVHRRDRGFRKSGGGVIEAFYEGYELVKDLEWDFLVKLDGDLTFPRDTFETFARRFREDPKLGLGGGTICAWREGQAVEESPGDPKFHVRGATKIYRRVCWEAMGGLIRAPGWDTLDEVKINMLGWRSYGFPEVKLIHHRHTGDADGTWKNWVKNGRANYNVGYSPVFMFLKCARRALRRPYFVAALALWTGFLSGYLERAPALAEPEVVCYLRREQWRKLAGRPSLWG